MVFDNNSTDGSAARPGTWASGSSQSACRARATLLARCLPCCRSATYWSWSMATGPIPPRPRRFWLHPCSTVRPTWPWCSQPEPGAGAMSPVRGLGNLLIRLAFRLLIGKGTGDLLSGYRASPSFLRPSTLRSRRLRDRDRAGHRGRDPKVADTRSPRRLPATNRRHAQQAGAFRDGRRILKTILVQSLRRDPARVILAFAFCTCLSHM